MKGFIIIVIGFLSSYFLIQGEELELKYPKYWPTPAYDLVNKSLKVEKVELGKTLFYDPILSSDLSISCASCHSPFNAFAHTDHDLSHGIDDKIGIRNAPPLFNLAWHKSFMWDGAVNHLDVQSLAPITSPTEMGDNIENVIDKLQESEMYNSLFTKAFGDNKVTGYRFLSALAQFQLTLVSANTKYDRVKEGIDTFTVMEERGYNFSCNIVINAIQNHYLRTQILPVMG